MQLMKSKGVTLIEVLAAVLILALGIVVFSVMQVNSMNMAMESHKFNLANNIMTNLADKIRINASNQTTLTERTSVLNAYRNYNWGVTENCEVIPPIVLECTPDATKLNLCDSYKMVRYDAYNAKCSSYGVFKRTSMFVDKCSSSNNLCIYYSWNGNPATSSYCSGVDSSCAKMEVFVE